MAWSWYISSDYCLHIMCFYSAVSKKYICCSLLRQKLREMHPIGKRWGLFVVRVDGLGLDGVLMNLGLNHRLDQVRLLWSLLYRDLAEPLVEELQMFTIEAWRLAVILQQISWWFDSHLRTFHFLSSPFEEALRSLLTLDHLCFHQTLRNQ